MRSESASHFFHEIRIVLEKGLLANASGKPEEAKPVQDGDIKASHSRQIRIYVEGVLVVA